MGGGGGVRAPTTKVSGISAERDHRSTFATPKVALRFQEVVSMGVLPGVTLDRGGGGDKPRVGTKTPLGRTKGWGKLTRSGNAFWPLHVALNWDHSYKIIAASNTGSLGRGVTPLGRRTRGRFLTVQKTGPLRRRRVRGGTRRGKRPRNGGGGCQAASSGKVVEGNGTEQSAERRWGRCRT